MSKQTDLGTEGSGILYPVIQHQWKIRSSLPEDIDKLITAQAIKCSINIVKETFYLEIEQPVSSLGLFEGINIMAKGIIMFNILHMRGDQAITTLAFEAKLIDHVYELDYHKSNIAIHKLSFEKVQLLKSADDSL